MPDWNTRLEVSVNGTTVSPIDSFMPTITTPRTTIHSIESDNVGAVFQPKTATFSMTLKAISPAVATLAQMALGNTKFNIQVAEKTGTDWTFKKLLFRDCLITAINPSNVTPDGAPVATVTGIILGFGEDSDIET
jgi:hypothetical protein